MTTKNVLEELVSISNEVGSDISLVQGGGGNTSAKTDDGTYMYIKASGTSLKDMSTEAGWRRQKVQSVLNVIGDPELEKIETYKRENEIVSRLLGACDDEHNAAIRPSVEAPLHALLDKYVVHVHPPVINAYVNAREGQQAVEKLFADQNPPILWVPYANPGYSLARIISWQVNDYLEKKGCKPRVIFLGKHGLFVSENTTEKVLALVHEIVDACAANLPSLGDIQIPQPEPAAIEQAGCAIQKVMSDVFKKQDPVGHVLDETVAAFMERDDAAALLAEGPLTPDEVVYANGPAVWLEDAEPKTIENNTLAQMNRTGKVAAAFIVKGLGLFVAADDSKRSTIEAIASSFLYPRMCAEQFGGLIALDEQEQTFINKWESESYRQKLLETG